MAETAIMMLPSLLQAAGGIMGASDKDKALNDQAKLLERRGTEALAASQRTALVEGKKNKLLASKFRATAGQSGAGGKGIADLQADLETKGDYASMVELFNGRSAQKAGFDQADELREQGELGKKASYTKAFTGLLGSAASNGTKYT